METPQVVPVNPLEVISPDFPSADVDSECNIQPQLTIPASSQAFSFRATSVQCYC